jgi:hypothetical protein
MNVDVAVGRDMNVISVSGNVASVKAITGNVATITSTITTTGDTRRSHI